MSFFVFALIFAFIMWQRLSKSRLRGPDVRSDAGRPASRASADDDDAEDIATDVAGLVSGFLGQKGQELIGQAVSRAIEDARAGSAPGRSSTERTEPIRKAPKKTASQPRDKQRARYLLDGDGGYRQRTDRTARLQQQFGGKGLCSPHSGSVKASRGFATEPAANNN